MNLRLFLLLFSFSFHRSSLDGLTVETVLDRPLVGQSSAFAVDWLSGNIYFVTELTEIIENMSPKTSNIFVSNLEGEYLT
jgi:hypothetical protein